MLKIFYVFRYDLVLGHYRNNVNVSLSNVQWNLVVWRPLKEQGRRTFYILFICFLSNVPCLCIKYEDEASWKLT